MKFRRCLLPSILCSSLFIGALTAYSLSLQAAVANTAIGIIPQQA